MSTGRRKRLPPPTPSRPATAAASVAARPWRWLLLAIVAFAALLRLAHVFSMRGTVWFDQLVVDPEYYDGWAQRIAAGDWFGDRPFYLDPLYAYVLGALYRVFGRDLLLARLLNVAFSAGSCALVGMLGRRVGGGAVGLVAAGAFAVYKPEIFYVSEVEKTALSVLLTAAFLVAALGESLRQRFAAGVLIALAALTRANFLLVAPLLGLAYLLRRDERAVTAGPLSKATASAICFALGVGLVLAPVLWRNHRVSGEWLLTTAQAGQNFYIGNNPYNPSGAYGALPFVRANPQFEEIDFRAAAEQRAGRALTAGEVSRFWWQESFRHMREQPAFAADVMLRKAALFWNDFEVSDNQDQYLLANDCWVLRLPLLGFGAVAPFALLGALVGFRAHRDVRLLCGFVAVYWASIVAFYVFSRYRIQVVPALLPLAGLGVVEWIAQTRARAWRRAAGEALLIAAAAWFCLHTIGIFSADNELVADMRAQHLAMAYLEAGEADRAIAVLEQAVERCPLRCKQTLPSLLDAYAKRGRAADAEAFLRRLTAAVPEHAEAWLQLSRLLHDSGRHEEALECERRGAAAGR